MTFLITINVVVLTRRPISHYFPLLAVIKKFRH